MFIIHDCFWKTEIYRHKHIMPSVFLLPFSINFFLHNLFLFKNNLCILLLQIPIRKWIFFLTSPSYSKYYSCICTLDWSVVFSADPSTMPATNAQTPSLIALTLWSRIVAERLDKRHSPCVIGSVLFFLSLSLSLLSFSRISYLFWLYVWMSQSSRPLL